MPSRQAHNDTAPLRPRAPPTQKRPSETPFRSGRNSSQAPRGHFNAFETPSKARPGSQTRSLADGDTRTPGRMTTRLSASKAGELQPPLARNWGSRLFLQPPHQISKSCKIRLPPRPPCAMSSADERESQRSWRHHHHRQGRTSQRKLMSTIRWQTPWKSWKSVCPRSKKGRW